MLIGNKLKELRKSQGLTLVQLAEKSGVQVATLSRIENLKMTGTLESHMALAKALGIDLTQLYSDIVPDESKVDLKTSKKEADVFVHSDKSSYEILTSNVLKKKMMPVLLTVEPGGCTNKEQYQPPSERFVYVLDGKVEVHIGEKSYSLGKNNSLYFDASMEHWFDNNAKKTAKLINVLTPVTL